MAIKQEHPSGSPLSLQRLTAAFAQMLGGSPIADQSLDGQQLGGIDPPQAGPARDSCEIGPRSIVEAILFVGAEGGRPRTAEELAGAMRDVTPDEVRQAVVELNEAYERDAAPYEIAGGAGGYRLRLREAMGRMRDKFHGRVKQASLSPTALEVLSVVAYRQPTTAATIDRLRGVRSGPLLTQLVRRGLLRRERPEETTGEPRFLTTDRFLQFFRLDSLEQLPRAAELDD
jgi:segregation and condensation protein B